MLPEPDITQLLQAWTGGDRQALDALMPAVIDQLKRIAATYLAREPHARTLQTTALVNEAYLRLVRVRPYAWANRGEFFALTARTMRRILVDYARAKVAEHRGGDSPRIEVGSDAAERASGPQSLLGLNDALMSLEKMDERKSRIVDLRLFTGLTSAETAEALGISERTVMREWQFAKAWLARELNYDAPDLD
jgi:RNA polymerase sigma factor (TIGR02999 family)